LYLELLEWLACELVEGGFSLKRLHRLIVSSEAYARDSRITPEASALDPDNVLLGRFTRRRLEAEAIRDAMLHASGALDRTPGGPGTLDPLQRRRSLYFTVKRSRLVPMMALLDAPDALQGIDRRPATSVAPQALLFMNDRFVRETASALAARIRAEAAESGPDALVRAGFRRALGRAPDPEEAAAAIAFLAEQEAAYAARGAADASLADFAHCLLMLNEFVHLD
jgi:hypothetical protein